MSRTFLGLLAVVVAVHGCTPEKQVAYQRLADELNPIFLTLIPKVAVIGALGPDAYENAPNLAAACASTDAELVRLQALTFDDPALYPHASPGMTLSWEADHLLRYREAMCVESRPDWGLVRGTCRWWCLDRWQYFTERIADISAAAWSQGVNVLPMPRVRGPGTRLDRFLPVARDVRQDATGAAPAR